MIERADLVRQKLQTLAKKHNLTSVIVGYTVNYALYVHENEEMKWKGLPRKGKHSSGQKRKGHYWDPTGRGQSKFLEQPFRENRDQIANTVLRALQSGVPLNQALVLGGLLLQRLSQELVPVDTGNLRASAFTREEQL